MATVFMWLTVLVMQLHIHTTVQNGVYIQTKLLTTFHSTKHSWHDGELYSLDCSQASAYFTLRLQMRMPGPLYSATSHFKYM